MKYIDVKKKKKAPATLKRGGILHLGVGEKKPLQKNHLLGRKTTIIREGGEASCYVSLRRESNLVSPAERKKSVFIQSQSNMGEDPMPLPGRKGLEGGKQKIAFFPLRGRERTIEK